MKKQIKARTMVTKFMTLGIDIETAKKCAVVSCNEIINAGSPYIDSDFWRDVIVEIEKL